MNSVKRTTEPDLVIPPHIITPEHENLISQALNAEKARINEKSTKE